MSDWFAATNPDPVTRSGTLEIVLAEAKPNATIKVSIADGEGFTAEVEIVTDGDGNGAVEWYVPLEVGPTLFLDAEGSDTHSVGVFGG